VEIDSLSVDLQSLPKLNLPSLEAVQKELQERSPYDFLQAAWDVIEPHTDYVHNWHIDDLLEHFQLVVEGEITRLIVNLPPRNMKSIPFSVVLPCWAWTKRPYLKWIFGSYSASLSTMHSVDRRLILESDWYRGFWPDAELSADQNQKTEYTNKSTGAMISTSVGGTITGKGADIIVIDDPLNPEQALSESFRETCNRWIDHTVSTRLNDKRKGGIILVMHRLHEEDTAGHLLKKGGWHHICLSSPANEDKVYEFPISGKRVAVKAGEPLWNEREPIEVLEQQKIHMGRWAFAGQYRQSPAPLEGGVIKRDGFRFYREIPDDLDCIINSWDMTFKDTTDGSHVCGQAWGRRGANKYLLDQVRQRMGAVRTIEHVKNLYGKWNPLAVLVEDKANGPAIIDLLRDEVSGFIEFNPQGSKIERLQAVSPQFEAGNIYVPHPDICPWIEDYMDELCGSLRNKRNDQADTTSQALLYYHKNEELTGDLFNSNRMLMVPSESGNLTWDF
tara:strand:+ start:905 stop:2413 length:1509 start_codon:yes stop_codon:yes gene_type:complete